MNIVTKDGTIFNVDEKNPEADIAVITSTAEGNKFAAAIPSAALLEFAEAMFEAARYETVIRMRVQAGDVIILRVPYSTTAKNAERVEQEFRKRVLEPLHLENKVALCTLSNDIDVEVVGKG
jgi:hypothetical protein